MSNLGNTIWQGVHIDGYGTPLSWLEQLDFVTKLHSDASKLADDMSLVLEANELKTRDGVAEHPDNFRVVARAIRVCSLKELGQDALPDQVALANALLNSFEPIAYLESFVGLDTVVRSASYDSGWPAVLRQILEVEKAEVPIDQDLCVMFDAVDLSDSPLYYTALRARVSGFLDGAKVERGNSRSRSPLAETRASTFGEPEPMLGKVAKDDSQVAGVDATSQWGRNATRKPINPRGSRGPRQK